MNAKKLFISDGVPAGIWYCGECRNVAKTQEQAEDCCKKLDCRICGKPCDYPYWRVHTECKKQEAMAKADKLEAWDWWVYLEGAGKEYFENVGELLEELENDEQEIPEFVFICQPIHFKAPDIEDLIADCLSGHYDDAYDAINNESYMQLESALEDFQRANSHIISYEPDYTKMVRVR